MSVKLGFTAQQIIDEGRVRQEDIDVLKTWLGIQNFPKLTDEQIVLFLLSCQNEKESTRTTIGSYYSIRSKSPRLFDNRRMDRADLQKQTKTVHLCVLPERTDDGCVVIYSKLSDTNYENFDMELYMMHLYMILDSAIYDHPPNGLIILYNMEGMGFMHLTRLRIGLMRTYFQYLQEGLPLRLQRAHMLNSVYFLDKLMGLLRPFIKTEVMALVHFHGPNVDMQWFYENCLPRRCLPEELGGDLPPTRELHEQSLEKLIKIQDYFDAEELQRRGISG